MHLDPASLFAMSMSGRFASDIPPRPPVSDAGLLADAMHPHTEPGIKIVKVVFDTSSVQSSCVDAGEFRIVFITAAGPSFDPTATPKRVRGVGDEAFTIGELIKETK